MSRRRTPLGVNVICAAEFPACRRAAIEVILASAVPFPPPAIGIGGSLAAPPLPLAASAKPSLIATVDAHVASCPCSQDETAGQRVTWAADIFDRHIKRSPALAW
jgi:hypothetical protein